MQINGSSLSVKFPSPFATAVTSFTSGGSGSGYSYITNNGTVRKFQFTLADSIGPVITAAQVVERAPGATIDTLYVTFSEALKTGSLKGASLILIQNAAPTTISIDSARMLTATRFALSLASIAPQPKPGDSLRINPACARSRPLRQQGKYPRSRGRHYAQQSPPSIVMAYYVNQARALRTGMLTRQ